VVLAAIVLAAASASANPPPVMPRTHTLVGRGAKPDTAPMSAISPYLVFNRCIGGCTIQGGSVNDARSNSSTLPCTNPTCTVGSCDCPGGSSGTWHLHEFETEYGDIGTNGHCYGDGGTTACTNSSQCSGTCTGSGGTTCVGGTHNGGSCSTAADCMDTCATADYEWNAIMQCLKDVYSPFNVTVSDTAPGGGVSFTEDFIAGTPADIGYGTTSTGGIAPGGCTAQDNVVSFSFSNINWGTGQDRIWTLCAVAGQETAHAFGLEHEYSFATPLFQSQDSTCMDPMTYRTDCGGEKFFRNAPSNCGEYMVRPCFCGGLQNSYQKILDVFGQGTSTIPAPTASILLPAANAMVQGQFIVDASTGSRRGVTRVELWLNGYRWVETIGAQFGGNGQPNPSTYQLAAPANVPNSVIDVQIKSFDDVGLEGDSPVVTVTKGSPCQDATPCLTGQMCANGRCFWNPPTGMLGDPCTYDQFCVSGMCSPTTTNQVCSQTCTVGVQDACPSGYDCVMLSGVNGFCYPSSGSGGGGGGCCETGSSGSGWASGGMAMLVLGLVAKRRRR
jgi:hypothetical protein